MMPYWDSVFVWPSFPSLMSQNKQYLQVVDKMAFSPLMPRVKYELAMNYYNQEEFEKSMDTFNEVVSKYPTSEYAKEALVKYKRSKAAYDEKKAHPDGDVAVKALYDVAQMAEELNNVDKAIESYQTIIERFPTSTKVAEAHFRIGFFYLKAR